MTGASVQKLLFVTGKGGVGKSAVAAAIAYRHAQAGKKTLLVELGYQSFFKDYLGLPQVGYSPVTTKGGFDVALWSGPECLKEYAIYLLKSASIYKLFFENPVSKALIQIAPGLSELAILGKITSGIRKVGPPLPYEVIVVDGFATGHFLALLKAPFGMAQAIKLGPMHDHSKGIDGVLKDRNLSEYHIVSLPEELPVVESLELANEMQSFLGIKPHLILNRILQIPSDTELQNSGSARETEIKQLLQIKERNQVAEQKLAQLNYPPDRLPQLFVQDSWLIVENLAKKSEAWNA